ncbi:glucocorticoid-induced transcript 1 protein-like [Liolophura sinensis]|uniref:glucocorticoid-induced transcript 1 protein-like n=1 Tax=Liolophura sinensis TaxID=3198878 RepID=UPI00315889CA
MSGQAPQRVRRIASPSTKQGPIKAVKAFTLMHGSPTRGVSRNSPSSSPTSILTSETHRIKSHRRSPDSRSSPERRSPNSPSFKVERPKAVRLSPASSSGLRRTGSLDTLRTGSLDAVGPYLTGQWPKDKTSVTSYHHYQTAGLLSCDKSTQTPDDWEVPSTTEGKRKGHKRSASLGNGDQIKEFRQRLQRGSKQSETTKQRQSPIPGNHLALSTAPPSSNYMQSKAIVIPTYIPKSNGPRAYPRNSVEGLNPRLDSRISSQASGRRMGSSMATHAGAVLALLPAGSSLRLIP